MTTLVDIGESAEKYPCIFYIISELHKYVHKIAYHLYFIHVHYSSKFLCYGFHFTGITSTAISVGLYVCIYMSLEGDLNMCNRTIILHGAIS